jgi:TM2 domain-containing membrane protein YozV
MLGLPQMIYGQVGKGLLWLAIGMVSTFVTAGFALFILYPLVIVDAHKIGKVLQSGRPVGKMEFFPK